MCSPASQRSRAIAKEKGFKEFKISISHCSDTVMAIAVAIKS
jgi:phosphopantetheinyl transferase (holo-ACP synthase)